MGYVSFVSWRVIFDSQIDTFSWLWGGSYPCFLEDWNFGATVTAYWCCCSGCFLGPALLLVADFRDDSSTKHLNIKPFPPSYLIACAWRYIFLFGRGVRCSWWWIVCVSLQETKNSTWTWMVQKWGCPFPPIIIVQWNIALNERKLVVEIPSRKLTYPPKMAFWRYFSFLGYVNSLEGIAIFLLFFPWLGGVPAIPTLWAPPGGGSKVWGSPRIKACSSLATATGASCIREKQRNMGPFFPLRLLFFGGLRLQNDGC